MWLPEIIAEYLLRTRSRTSKCESELGATALPNELCALISRRSTVPKDDGRRLHACCLTASPSCHRRRLTNSSLISESSCRESRNRSRNTALVSTSGDERQAAATKNSGGRRTSQQSRPGLSGGESSCEPTGDESCILCTNSVRRTDRSAICRVMSKTSCSTSSRSLIAASLRRFRRSISRSSARRSCICAEAWGRQPSTSSSVCMLQSESPEGGCSGCAFPPLAGKTSCKSSRACFRRAWGCSSSPRLASDSTFEAAGGFWKTPLARAGSGSIAAAARVPGRPHVRALPERARGGAHWGRGPGKGARP
mmetsp:Transcript_156530/g.502325  ORF Transcript_156530/g.502325 Transcript_156530/m.502325 type:complete len:309 (+) Transcript_156530:690-1616(+)